MSNYPQWICSPCGEKFGKRIPICATWHKGDECGWCGAMDLPLTEPRDFGWPAYSPSSHLDPSQDAA